MTTKDKAFIVIALVVVAIVTFVIVKVLPSNQRVGSVSGALIENYDPYVRINGGVNTNLPMIQAGGSTIGAAGTTLTQINKGTCTLYQYVNTIAASSSITTDCVNTSSSGFGTGGGLVALPGIQTGDTVFATLSTTTSALVATAGGLVLTGASASSTAGYITVTLINLKGATYTFPTTASTTVSYLTAR